LKDNSLEEQFADLGEFGVDDSDKRSVNRGEGGRGHLGFHDGSAEESLASDEILIPPT